MVLVDASSGAVVLNVDEIAEGLNRTVCDALNTTSQVPCVTPVRSEGGAATGPPDVDLAYDFAGKTYDFYLSRFARDSLDGAGLPLNSTVRYCDPVEPCPLQNAFWNGQQMVYGQGYASADDVVAHELTHGVTEFSSHLFYYYQSGAINESLSDIFGEFVDQTDGVDGAGGAVRWQLGEDLPIGAIRSLSDPPAHGDPDRTGSPLYFGGNSDDGGVHANSGVGNKFAYLLADGATFNGRTVAGLGVEKAARIIYRASQLLTSAADYRVFAAALRLSCTALVGSSGIVSADCGQVEQAIAATEMDTTPANAAVPTAPPVCGSAGTPTNVWSDDFEDPASGRWAGTGSTGWSYASQVSASDVRYGTSGVDNLYGDDAPTLADARMEMTADVAAVAGSYLRFNHAFGFQSDESGSYDGGLLEYSIDAGRTWQDAGPLITGNGYTGAIAAGFGNPLAGRSAFVGKSRGYQTSRVNLSSLAGHLVRFRFRLGTDVFGFDAGWFIDDVVVYICPITTPSAPTITSITPVAGALSVGFALGDDGGDPPGTMQYSTDGGATWTTRSPGGTSSPMVIAGLPRGATYSVRIRAANGQGPGEPSPAVPVLLPGPPGAPAIQQVTAGRGAITVTFASGGDGGLATSFAVSCSSPDGGAAGTVTGATPGSVVVGGLTNGRSYICRVTASNPQGSATSADSAAVTPVDPVVPLDTLPPRITVAALARVTLGAPVVTWTASDDTGVSQVQVRRRTTPAGGRPGAWSAPLSLAGSARRYVAPFQRGVTACLEVTVLDPAGNRSTGPIRCAATPVDDRSLAVGHARGWIRVASSKAYQRTLSTSHQRGATLTLAKARGRSLVLVASRGPRAGSLGVYVGGKRVAQIRLAAARTSTRQLVSVRTGLLRGVPVVLKVNAPGRAGVTVDGVAVLT